MMSLLREGNILDSLLALFVSVSIATRFTGTVAKCTAHDNKSRAYYNLITQVKYRLTRGNVLQN